MLEEFDPPAGKLIAAQLKRNCRVSDPNAKTPAVVDTSIPGLEGSDAERKKVFDDHWGCGQQAILETLVGWP